MEICHYCNIFMVWLEMVTNCSFNWWYMTQYKPFLLLFHFPLEIPRRRGKKKNKWKIQTCLIQDGSALLMLYHFSANLFLSLLLTHTHTPFLHLSLIPALLCSLHLSSPFPQAHIWLWGIDSDFIANCYSEMHTIVLWWAKQTLIWQIVFFSHGGTDSKTK